MPTYNDGYDVSGGVAVATVNDGYPTNGRPIHVTRTVTFTGGAGAGAAETAILFTVSGTILLDVYTAFISMSCASGGAGTLALGVTGSGAFWTSATAVASLTSNKWILGGSQAAAIGRDHIGGGSGSIGQITNDNLTWTIGTSSFTQGVIVFDLFYTPLTVGATVS